MCFAEILIRAEVSRCCPEEFGGSRWSDACSQKLSLGLCSCKSSRSEHGARSGRALDGLRWETSALLGNSWTGLMFAAVLEFKMPYSRYSLHAFMQFALEHNEFGSC